MRHILLLPFSLRARFRSTTSSERLFEISDYVVDVFGAD